MRLNNTLSAIQWFTDFGDQGVVLPVSAAVFCFLLLNRWWLGALWWILTVGGVLGLMLFLKLGIGACGWILDIPGLESPSGHAASATMIYGGLAAVLLTRFRGLLRVLPGIPIAILFALSRVLLHDHSILEVTIGSIIGLCGVGLFVRLSGPVPIGLRPVWLWIMIGVVAAATHGTRMTAEQHIHLYATLRLRALLCPMPR